MKGERRELTPQMKKRRRKKNIIGFTFILPSLIGFILFMAYPLIWDRFKFCVNVKNWYKIYE